MPRRGTPGARHNVPHYGRGRKGVSPAARLDGGGPPPHLARSRPPRHPDAGPIRGGGLEAFEYLSVLVSIILGLGITQLLLGFARWLERRAVYRPYGPSIAWAAFLLLVHVQTWWSMYGLRQHADWNFLQFSLVLLQPAVLFLMSVLIFPSAAAAEHDLRASFREQRPWFFGLFLALLGISVVKDLVRTDALPSLPNLAFHGLLASVGAAGLAREGDRAQHVIALVAVIVIVAYIGLLFAAL